MSSSFFNKRYDAKVDVTGEYLYIGDNTWRHESLVENQDEIDFGEDCQIILMEMIKDSFEEVYSCCFDGDWIDIQMRQYDSNDEEVLPKIEKMIRHVLDKKDIMSKMAPEQTNDVRFYINK